MLAKKSLPLSSTMMKAGKFSTSMRQMASIPSSSYSWISTFLMQFLASRRRPTDRSEIETAVLGASVRHGLRSVALRKHHHGSTVRLEEIDVGVHAAGGRGPERTGDVALRRLRRPRVVDDVILEVLRQVFARIEPFLELRVRDVARHDDRPRQRELRRHGVLRQVRAHFVHRPIEIDRDRLAGQFMRDEFGHVLGGICLELFEEDAFLRDLALDLSIGGARNAHSDRTTRAVARQSDHAYVVTEILPTELRSDADFACQLQDLFFEFDVAERAAMRVARCRQVVEVATTRELDGLEGHLRGRAPDHDRQVIRADRPRSPTT